MKTWQKLHKNPKLWARYFIRERVLAGIRQFFASQNFHEVETPLLIAHPPAESYLEVFETTLLDRNRRATRAFLSTSPEMPLKKLLVAGIGNCFSLTKSFRNTETNSGRHNPEFTILEYYRVGVGYEAIMDDCEQLVRFLYEYVGSGPPSSQNGRGLRGVKGELVYQGNLVDITASWERLTVAESFAKYAGIDFDKFFDMKNARKIAEKKGYRVEESNTWEELYNQIFLNEVEPHLGFGRPTILYEFPAVVAALAKLKESDRRYAERFEFYISGLELGDCYGELTDWQEQERRFDQELREIKKRGKTAYEYDRDFIEALKIGLPQSSGIAIGVDRLIMLLSDVPTIAETMFFPASEDFALPE